jgi:cytochrome c-type biogenesis protein CcsB
MNLKQVFNYLFIFSMLILPTFGLIKFNEYMDYYEMFILAATGITFILINKYWQNFSYLVSTILIFSFISIFLYEGNLLASEKQFALKYFLSSQSAIMWMCSLYPLSLLMYWFYLFKKNPFLGNFASNLTWIATVMGFVGLLVRWFESYLISIDVGHIPVSNLYEVFVLFCLITALLHLYYEEKMNRKELGAFILIIINIAVGFILWYTFSKGADEIQPLVPALQSYWMKIHVPANFIGYGAFAIAAMISIAYLLADKGILKSKLPSLVILDDLTYKAIAIGFIFFTIATILGAVWAAEAWGGYWSWDPKETWALIVWLNYAGWLHLRLVKGLRGPLLAWWSIIGLLITTFAFLGVNLLLSGLHSYGEL